MNQGRIKRARKGFMTRRNTRADPIRERARSILQAGRGSSTEIHGTRNRSTKPKGSTSNTRSSGH